MKTSARSPKVALCGLAVWLGSLSITAFAQSPATTVRELRLPPMSQADCDKVEHEQLLIEEHTSTSETLYRLPTQGSADASGPPQAIWLDDQTLRWPAMSANGMARFALLHSARASLRLERGRAATGGTSSLPLQVVNDALTDELMQRFRHLGDGTTLKLPTLTPEAKRELLIGQLVLVALDAQNRVVTAVRTQAAAALDALYPEAVSVERLGVVIDGLATAIVRTSWGVWAPTAGQVAVCLHRDASAPAEALLPMTREQATGVWRARHRGDLSGRSFTYLVDVFIASRGWIRNRVTDPYSLSLTADAERSAVLSLESPSLMPDGWQSTRRPERVRHASDLVLYRLHVRDFSASDGTVREPHRGKYLAFTTASSDGMKHLARLAQAGVTDVQFMPVTDMAAVPEVGCQFPMGLPLGLPRALPPGRSHAGGPTDSDFQQARVMEVANRDCYHSGDDPQHFIAPEGSYATDASDPAVRVRELRAMVQALHQQNLRVGMTVNFAHTTAAGQHPKSVLDRIVPGYYHRMRSDGAVVATACCEATALEQRMMAKLMIDAIVMWARDYRIDSFRMDAWGTLSPNTRDQLQKALDAATGRRIHLIGAGDEAGRDAALGGRSADQGEALVQRTGWLQAQAVAPSGWSLLGARGTEPSQRVNDLSGRDRHTLFDVNVLKLPMATSRDDRARVQVLGMALSALSPGIAAFEAGIEILRSKSGDRHSDDSGDWFNRIDWSLQDNHFGIGLPPQRHNGSDWVVLQPRLAEPLIKPMPAQIRFARDAFEDLLRIRASTTLLRLSSAAELQRRWTPLSAGPDQVPTLLAAHLDGEGLEGAGFGQLAYFINAGQAEATIVTERLAGEGWVLHPVHLAADAADARPAQAARLDSRNGRVVVPPRTAVVWVRR